MTSPAETSPPALSADEPFCRECGYRLTGCVDSSKCPECGRPLVEVLTRPSVDRRGKRWQSRQTVFGLPWISIASGPYGDEKVGRPVGVIAIGDYPLGVIAIGGVARGVVAIGGICVGVVGWGGLCAGVLAAGGLAVGVAAWGGVAVGAWSFGGVAIYLIKGFGGLRIPLGLW
jgi:hypothetical protein